MTHRPDLDGLRAVAIILVVGYHAGIPGFGAGFVGVDVFFVLSGFLITRIIASEIETTGTLGIGHFWVRRARRLVPASAVTVAGIVVANQLLTSPLTLMERSRDPLWALAYLTNYSLGADADDYFGTEPETNPFLHMWSLAVEEQFYILWPVVLLLLARFTAQQPNRTRAVQILAIAGASAGSFALCLALTERGTPWAFYLTISRMWEFGAGALLALVSVFGQPPVPARRALYWTGAGLVGIALLTVRHTDSFPGVVALIPVAATVALIAGRPTDGVLGRGLASQPAQFLGRLSYSWYLVHWPIIVLGSAALGWNSATGKTTLAVLSLLPALALHHGIENRLRHSQALERSAPRTVAVTVGFIVVAAGLWVVADAKNGSLDNDPLLASLHDARHDRTDVNRACSQLDAARVWDLCAGGDPSAPTVLVLGDSHAAHWIPAVERASEELHMSWAASVLGNCPTIGVTSGVVHPDCAGRRPLVFDLIDDIDPAIVVMSHSSGYINVLEANGRTLAPEQRLPAWSAELTEFTSELDRRGIPLLVVLDVPRFVSDPLDCAAEAGSTERCVVEGAALEKMFAFHRAERAALAEAGHGTSYDPTAWLCEPTACPLEVGGEIAYVDSHHVTAPVSRSSWPMMAAAIEDALANQQPS